MYVLALGTPRDRRRSAQLHHHEVRIVGCSSSLCSSSDVGRGIMLRRGGRGQKWGPAGFFMDDVESLHLRLVNGQNERR